MNHDSALFLWFSSSKLEKALQVLVGSTVDLTVQIVSLGTES